MSIYADAVFRPRQYFKVIQANNSIFMPCMVWLVNRLLIFSLYVYEFGISRDTLIYSAFDIFVIMSIFVIHYIAKLFKSNCALKTGVSCFLSVSIIGIYMYPAYMILLVFKLSAMYNILSHVALLWSMILDVLIVKEIYRLNMIASILVPTIVTVGWLLFGVCVLIATGLR